MIKGMMEKMIEIGKVLEPCGISITRQPHADAYYLDLGIAIELPKEDLEEALKNGELILRVKKGLKVMSKECEEACSKGYNELGKIQ